MDGGRVLRSLLAMRMDYARATRIAAAIGQGMAVLFGFVGLFANPMLLLIALFVWIGATQEAAAAQMKSSFAGAPVREAMLTDFRALSPQDTLADATQAAAGRFADRISRSWTTGAWWASWITAALFQALRERGDRALVGDVMRSEFVTLRGGSIAGRGPGRSARRRRPDHGGDRRGPVRRPADAGERGRVLHDPPRAGKSSARRRRASRRSSPCRRSFPTCVRAGAVQPEFNDRTEHSP